MDELTERVKPYILISAVTLLFIFLVVTGEIIIGAINWPVYLASLLVILLAGGGTLWLFVLMKRKQIAPTWVHISLVSNLLLIVTALYFNGALQTTWGFLPMIVIVLASFLFDTPRTVLYAILSFVLLMAVYALDYLNILPHQMTFAVPFAYWKYPNYLIDYITGLLLLFALTAAASAYFTYVTRAATKSAQKTTEDLVATRAELERHAQECTELFDNSPVSLWEEDYGELNAYFDSLKRSGVGDFAEYFSRRPEEIAKCVSLIRIVNVNRATLSLYGAGDLKEFQAGLAGVFTPESYEVFTRELVALAQGKTYFESEAVNRTLSGEKKRVLLKMTVLPGRQRVLISIGDLSDQKRVEEDLQQKMKELKAFSDASVGRELKMVEMEKELARLRELVNR